MAKTIDNFKTFSDRMTFESDFDRYIVHIIKRGKDDKGKSYGTNETNRLIKTFYITSKEYFERKIPVIKDMCESYGARAYILPQVRNNEECLRELLKIVVDNLSNPTIKPDHLVRSAFCGHHGSRDKKWILDLDSDNMVEYREELGFPRSSTTSKEWTPEEVLDMVRGFLKKIGKNEDDAFLIETKSGHSIVTSPFNLQDAFRKCNMMFQGVTKKVIVGSKSIGPGEYEDIRKDINGWVIKDGMALLYYSQEGKPKHGQDKGNDEFVDDED